LSLFSIQVPAISSKLTFSRTEIWHKALAKKLGQNDVTPKGNVFIQDPADLDLPMRIASAGLTLSTASISPTS
jgi:hypothetical protein